MPGNCSFQEVWLEDKDFKQWLAADKDKFSAKCSICKKTFSVRSMGISAVKSHMHGDNHCRNLKMRSGLLTLTSFLRTPQDRTGSTGTIVGPESEPAATTTTAGQANRPTSASRPTGTVMNQTALNRDILTSEILWAVYCVKSHYSYNSCASVGSTFRRMFPDSEIASKFTCGDNKVQYLIGFGLKSYLENLISDQVKGQQFVLMFDESHNAALNKKQLDIHVRFWDRIQNQVVRKYLTSEFIGHGRADDLKPLLLKIASDYGTRNLVQISMDGPAVNWKLHDSIAADMNKVHGLTLLNVGSCGIHTVHNAFKTADQKSDLSVGKILKCLYWVFHDSPARCEDYTKICGNSDCEFPLPFCGHRWLENLPVCQRAEHIWPNIVKYVRQIESSSAKDKYSKPTSASYCVIRDCARDQLVPTKLAFFISVASQLSPFLTMFQSELPLLPFLSSHLERMIRNLMKRFIRDHVLRQANSLQKLLKIDVQDNENHLPLKNIDIGCKAEKQLTELQKGTLSERNAFDLRVCCKQTLMLLVNHLLSKTPINYSLARNMCALDPKLIIKEPETTKKKFRWLLDKLVEAKRMDEGMCDKVRWQFQEFVEHVQTLTGSERERYREYDPLSSVRLDTFLQEDIHSQKNWHLLWDVLQMILIMSHGQAGVERGFSQNKEILTENMRENTLIAQRLLIDYLSHIGGFDI